MHDTNVVPQLSDALSGWHEFYSILGEASATLIGLLFVAASVGSRAFTDGRRSALRVFLSASVIHFSTILTACLITMVPTQSWKSPGMMIAACGIFGLAYYGLTWRDMLKDGLSKSIDWDDRIWYAAFPVIVYLLEAGSGVALAWHMDLGCLAVGLAMWMLLVIGIHNAWDITVWSITRPRE
jgi:hypothetical protein